MQEITESEFLRSVQFCRIVNVVGMFRAPGSNPDSRLPGTSLGPPREELVIGCLKVVKKMEDVETRGPDFEWFHHFGTIPYGLSFRSS